MCFPLYPGRDWKQISVLLLPLHAVSAAAALTMTSTNQQGFLPFTPTWAPGPASLIAGASPLSASGNFSLEVAGRNVQSLTAGGSLTITELPGNNTSTNYVTCGNGYGAGSLVIYGLPPAANGYDLTNITVYGGWKDNGRNQQAYTVSYSTVDSPASFSVLTSVNYNPSVPSGIASATRVTLADAAGGTIASRVAAIQFDFTSPPSENGFCGYAAITAQGIPSGESSGMPAALAPGVSPATAATGISAGTVVTLSAGATGAKPMGYRWRSDGGSGGALTNIPAAMGTNLVINTTGFSLGTYRYDFVASNSLGTSVSPAAGVAVVSLADIGPSAPNPGPLDISQLLNTAQDDDGLNYYTDNGPSYGRWCGQTFTAGSDPGGYLLKQFTWKSAGNGSGFANVQPYHLHLYSVSADGTRASHIASFKASSSGTEGNWLRWQGLNVPLSPNQVYAYAIGRDASGSGWEHIGNQGGNPYASGQLMTVAHTTGDGPITYGNTGTSDASFHLGLTAYGSSAPWAMPPVLKSGAWPVYAGVPGTVTVNEAALGAAPFSYQWLSDNGAGGALTPLTGATISNLLVNTETLTAGNYRYAVIVSNAFGASLSPAFTLTVLGPTAPSVVTHIAPVPVNIGNVGQTVTYSAVFTGTPPLSYQWYFNAGYGPVPISPLDNPGGISNTLMIQNLQLAHDGVYFVTAQNSSGSTTSGVSTLAVIAPPGTPPRASTVPPVNVLITNSAGAAQIQWAQGTLQQAPTASGPWTPLATNLEASSRAVPMTNAAAYFRSQVASQPRIVNLYCFCRQQDYRLANSQQVLFNATTQQVQLFKQANLPATFALQHDALMDTNYTGYFKAHLTTNDEIGAWWEITQSLVERAGLVWRGDHEWVSTANIAFSPGYAPAERIQLVNTYMADFHAIFGYYPKSVGSWYIDEVTIEYMRQQYGIVASANCKDQLGTDTYTLWGSYWNQAYYPSRLNSFMPAQTPAGQIDVPIFRLLGSDPIYQYGGSVITLEPVYPSAGGSPKWVAWFFNALIKQPSLAFGFAQAGQENSFGWNSMAAGLINQVALISAERQAGNVQVLTLAQAGAWFRKNYSVTPPTSVVALDDWQEQGRKSVWYNSRFFRLNLLWQQDKFLVRDLHCFDESVTSYTHSTALTTDYFIYETLPVMDSGQWSGNGGFAAGMWPVNATNGSVLTPQGMPVVKQLSPTDLSVVQPLSGGGAFSILLTENSVTCIGTNLTGQSLNWAWNLVGGSQQAAAVQNVSSNSVAYQHAGANYQVRTVRGMCQQIGNGDIRLLPDQTGTLVLDLNVTD
jgi:hypothetical protein